MADANSPISKLDANQIMRMSYDDAQQRLRVGAEISATVADMNLDIDAASGDNIAISDGEHTLSINADGTVNVRIIGSELKTRNIFNEVQEVASGVTSTIMSYQAITETKLLSVDVGGGNIASYEVRINGQVAAKKYTYFQNLNERFQFADGISIPAGQTIEVVVAHTRPSVADFNANLLIQN